MLKYTKGYYNEVTIMKAMAAFFITWFHLKGFVPEQFAFIFIGGAIGNSLFFYCSGYLLRFKEERYHGEWLLKKYVRIMPTVWVFMLFVMFVSMFRTESDVHYVWNNWIYPTRYWFVNCILCFFLISYFLRNFLRTDIMKTGGGVIYRNVLSAYGFSPLSYNLYGISVW